MEEKLYFDEIFNRSFNLFSDPDLEKKYFHDPASFQAEMLEYLKNGKNKFTYPTAITDKLCDIEEAVGKTITIDGEGTAVYTLEPEECPEQPDYTGITYRINNKPVRGSFNSESREVTFEREVAYGETCSVTWFYAGAFLTDFSGCLRSDFSVAALREKVITILAYALLSAYGDKEVGRVLEVRNILTDTDFNMYSPANSARAKMEWRDKMNANMDTLVTELNWRIMATPNGGSRFGK